MRMRSRTTRRGGRLVALAAAVTFAGIGASLALAASQGAKLNQPLYDHVTITAAAGLEVVDKANGLDCTFPVSSCVDAVPVAPTGHNTTFTVTWGWKGGCGREICGLVNTIIGHADLATCSQPGTCTFNAKDGANLDLTDYLRSTVAVAFAGSGGGTVTSKPAGLACSSSCGKTALGLYELDAAPDKYSEFTGWSNASNGLGCVQAACGGGSQDNAAYSVTAVFSLNSFPLSVGISGSGAGTVTDASGRVACASSCTVSVSRRVSLTASASKGSSFGGWGGACSGSGSCSVDMTRAQAVTARFDKKSSSPTPTTPVPTTPTPTVPVPTTPSPTAPAPKPVVHVVYAVVTGSGVHRKLQVSVRSSEAGSAQVRLLRLGFERAERVFRVRAGHNLLVLGVPVSVKKGLYSLRLTERDAAGHTTTATATIPVPS